MLAGILAEDSSASDSLEEEGVVLLELVAAAAVAAGGGPDCPLGKYEGAGLHGTLQSAGEIR